MTRFAVIDLSRLGAFTAHGPLSRDQCERILAGAQRPLVVAEITRGDVRLIDGANLLPADVARCGDRMAKVYAALGMAGLLPATSAGGMSNRPGVAGESRD